MDASGGNRGDGMPAVQGLIRGQHVVAQVFEPGRAFAEIDHLVAGIGQISARENGLDPGQGSGFRRVYGLDARMGVGRAQDLSVEQAGQPGVGAVNGAPSDLVNAVVADGAGADDFVAVVGRHGVPPRWVQALWRTSSAASRTARMILS